MQFQFLTVLFPLLAVVNGAPTVELTAPATAEELARFGARVGTPGPAGSVVATSALDKRAITHLYFCQNPNFLNPC